MNKRCHFKPPSDAKNEANLNRMEELYQDYDLSYYDPRGRWVRPPYDQVWSNRKKKIIVAAILICLAITIPLAVLLALFVEPDHDHHPNITSTTTTSSTLTMATTGTTSGALCPCPCTTAIATSTPYSSQTTTVEQPITSQTTQSDQANTTPTISTPSGQDGPHILVLFNSSTNAWSNFMYGIDNGMIQENSINSI